ncbi:MAG: zinc finger domain-containing protein [Pseudomonadota bacterium]
MPELPEVEFAARSITKAGRSTYICPRCQNPRAVWRTRTNAA